MLTPTEPIRLLHDALTQCLDTEKTLSDGLRKSADNLARALCKTYALADDAPAPASTPGPALSFPPAAPITNSGRKYIDQKIRDLQQKIVYAIENGNQTAALEQEIRLLASESEAEEYIDWARRRGANTVRERENLARLLTLSILGREMRAYWKELPAKAYWFEKKAAKDILRKARKEIRAVAEQKGRPAAERWLEDVREVYGEALAELTMPPEIRPVSEIEIPSNTIHALPALKPSQRWSIYIDETGQSFSDEEQGREGRITAVCTRQGQDLPAMHIHCTEVSPAEVLTQFAALLNHPCGILGLSKTTLDVRSSSGWLQTVRELVKWIWRLLPLPEGNQPSYLDIRVEQRAEYKAEVATEFGKDMLQAELIRENPERADKIRIQTFSFVSKNDPQCSWADVASYCWGSTYKDIRSALRKSGLFGPCLITLPASVVDCCQDIMMDNLPDPVRWTELFKAHAASANRNNPLTPSALKALQTRCLDKPALWSAYARAMQDYLLGKDYDLGVLEKMAEWFEPMQTSDLTTRYFFLSARLAQFNHMGDAVSDELESVRTELCELAPEMSKLNPMADLHVALRLAVADANAFDFARAEQRLARWNPAENGQLTGSALWDGKILSSLGQYRAFQRDLPGACRLFRDALHVFATLPEEEARRQLPQTQNYLAIASMDRHELASEDVRRLVEESLGASIEEFCTRMGTAQGLANRYGHYLLTRYLSRRGTREERELYLRTQDNWATQEEGYGAGHPWPIIQYHRWLLADREDTDLRRQLASTIYPAMGRSIMPTVELIAWAIIISMGELDPKDQAVAKRLRELEAMMPESTPVVQQISHDEPGDELLAQRILPFNYC